MSEVFWSPVTSIHENFPPGTVLVGVPGSGKSFCLLNIAASSIEMGCNVFVLDAKNDMLPLKRLFPDIKITDVNNISAGALDPFLVFPNVDASIILTITGMLCGELSPEQKLAITPIINDFVKHAKEQGATFREFADYLYQNKNIDAQSVGNALLMNADTKYGSLIFGQQGKISKGIKIDNVSRVISILGMELPSGSNLPKADEMLNAAVVYIICKMLKELLTKKTVGGKLVDKRPNVLILDECHMLMRSQAICDIIDELLVLGRSLGVAIVMASQNVTHFPQEIAQLVSTKISFRLSKQEASEYFTLFNNTVSGKEIDIGDSISLVTRLATGNCFMIDSRDRSALVHVTSMYDQGDITSNPLMKKEDEETKSTLNIRGNKNN